LQGLGQRLHQAHWRDPEMMTQEEFMDVMAMKRQGLSIREIAEETGYHPSTVSSWLRHGGPPVGRERSAPAVIDELWAARIAELLRAAPRLLATSVFELIKTEGYGGSYVSVARHLNALRGPRFHAAPAASTRIVTAPGEECQFDWSDVSHWTRQWGLGEVQCFSAILSWSRVRIWWFARSIDRQYTFEGLVRFFEFVGGVPKVLRTDRMGALGQSQGRRFTLHPPAVAFAQFHSTEIRACQAGDAKRKGKIERPFRDVKERFLEECAATGAPTSVAELNDRAAFFLDERIHSRLHRGMGAVPAEKLVVEAPLLTALPRRRFDTAYVEARRVHVAIPQIEWRSVRYSVPPRCLGQRVEVRHEVDSSSLEIRWAGEVVARHTVADTGEVWDAGHWQAAQQAALSRNRARHLSVVVPDVVAAPVPRRLDIEGDVDVEVPDLARYETDGGRS
ncbi:MAG: IS21 family transposase, partial [Acidimicrobiales bacterium]